MIVENNIKGEGVAVAMTADEVRGLTADEVARISSEVNEVINALGMAGLSDSFVRVKGNEACKNLVSHLILGSYNVREEWGEVSEELAQAWRARVKMWESVGAYEGMLIRNEVILPKEFISALDHADEVSAWFSLSMPRDIRRSLGISSGGGSWRLSFRPGAILSAPQRDGDLWRNIACFGAGEGYEGTAGQMVFDPHIAVLEKLDEYGKRETGFQMVALSPSGVHAYGGCYTGYDTSGEQASTLAYNLARTIRGGGGCDYAEANNNALDKLASVLFRSSNTLINAPSLYASAVNGPRVPDARIVRRDAPCFNDSTMWSPIDGVDEAYKETVYRGGFFASGVEFDKNKRLFNSDKVNELLSRVGIGRPVWGHCDNCDETIYEDQAEDGEYWCGDEYGLGDTYYCCRDCLREAMENEATDELNGVLLIDGNLYELP